MKRKVVIALLSIILIGLFQGCQWGSSSSEGTHNGTSESGPTVMSATALSTTAVSIVFDKKILPGSVTDPAVQFTFSGVAALSAENATVNGNTVTVITTDQAPGFDYTVTVADTVTDLPGMGVDVGSGSVGFAGFIEPGIFIVEQDACCQSTAALPDGGLVCVYYAEDPDQPWNSTISARHYSPLSGWSNPAWLDSDTDSIGGGSDVSAVADSVGNVLTAWSVPEYLNTYDYGRIDIWSNRYLVGQGWGSSELVETNNTDDAYDVKLAMTPDGEALAVWEQRTAPASSIFQNVWSRFYSNTSGWMGSAQMVENNTYNITPILNPDVAMDPFGNAFVIWRDLADGGTVYARRNDLSTGWEQMVTLGLEGDSGDFSSPVVKTDASGNAVAVWHNWDGFQYNIAARIYSTTASAWGNSIQVAVAGSGDAPFPKLSVNPAGEAVVVWTAGSSPDAQLWAARYLPASGWEPASRVDLNGHVKPQSYFDSATFYDVAVDPDGNAYVSWIELGSEADTLWASRYTAGEGWGTPFMVMDGVKFSWSGWNDPYPNLIAYIDVLFDSEGKGVLVWSNDRLGIMMKYLD